MAYSKQTWDTTSYVNPTRMNHIENGIEEVSNKIDNLDATNIPYDSNTSVKEKIDSITDFSTTETVVGKWIDGKTLYRKVYSKTFTFTAGETVDDVFSVDDLNADTIIIENGFIRIQSNITYVGNEAFVAFIRRTDWDRIAVKCDNVAYSGGTLVFVVLYTKA